MPAAVPWPATAPPTDRCRGIKSASVSSRSRLLAVALTPPSPIIEFAFRSECFTLFLLFYLFVLSFFPSPVVAVVDESTDRWMFQARNTRRRKNKKEFFFGKEKRFWTLLFDIKLSCHLSLAFSETIEMDN